MLFTKVVGLSWFPWTSASIPITLTMVAMGQIAGIGTFSPFSCSLRQWTLNFLGLVAISVVNTEFRLFWADRLDGT